MKKVTIIWLFLFLGLSFQTFAKFGVAEGGFEFMLAVVGFLLLIAGLFAGTEYLIKNGRNLLNRFKTFLKKNIFAHRNSV